MTRRARGVVGLGAMCLVLAGCGSDPKPTAKETGWSPEAGQYAVYATRIPLYPGTTIEDAMGSDRYSRDFTSSSYGMTWWCTAKATRDELRSWYEARLPGATRVTNDDGHLVLTVVPEGAAEREDMGVLIEGDGKYRVFEHTRQKKPGT